MPLRNPPMIKMLKRFGWVDDDPSKDLEAVYLAWIYGINLDRLAAKLGTTTTILRRLLAKKYGAQATSLFSKSLVRSLAEDYPDSTTVEEFIKTQLSVVEPPRSYVATMSESLPVKPIFGGVHRSVKGLNNISKHEGKNWTAPEMLDRLGVLPSNGRRVGVVSYE